MQTFETPKELVVSGHPVSYFASPGPGWGVGVGRAETSQEGALQPFDQVEPLS